MKKELTTHLLRTGFCFAGHAAALRSGQPIAAHVAAAATYYAAFAFSHDLTHGTFGLSPRARKWMLGAAAQLLLVSGQVMRTLHLRHHARPGAPDDIEGAPIGLGFVGTCVRLPFLLVSMRVAALRIAKPSARRWMIAETILNALIAAAALVLAPLRSYVLVALTLQVLAPLWASYVPHRAPEWLRALARRFDFARSPTMMSLAYHDLHHERAEIPCQNLATYAHAVGW
jgi:fatty acid desaturase